MAIIRTRVPVMHGVKRNNVFRLNLGLLQISNTRLLSQNSLQWGGRKRHGPRRQMESAAGAKIKTPKARVGWGVAD